MDVNQASLMQLQIKNNAADLEDFMKGLESWEDEIKEKDRNLSNQKPILKEVGVVARPEGIWPGQSPGF